MSLPGQMPVSVHELPAAEPVHALVGDVRSGEDLAILRTWMDELAAERAAALAEMSPDRAGVVMVAGAVATQHEVSSTLATGGSLTDGHYRGGTRY